ncbi:MAG: YfcE family phosphodiesterase [Candidatus Nanohaloarchaea archaeon]
MIAILSDSHVPNRAPEIPQRLLERADKADKAVHCGDIVSKEIYYELEESFDDFVAVKGNCERFDLSTSEKFQIDGLEFGVYHGTGIHPRGDHDTLLEIARNKMEVDVLLHGHTHREEIFRSGDTILLNPGSCTGVGGGSATKSDPTMMEAEVRERTIRARLLELSGDLKAVSEEEFEL